MTTPRPSEAARDYERGREDERARIVSLLHENHDRLCACMQEYCGACEVLKVIGAPKHPHGDGYREHDPSDCRSCDWIALKPNVERVVQEAGVAGILVRDIAAAVDDKNDDLLMMLWTMKDGKRIEVVSGENYDAVVRWTPGGDPEET